MLVIRFANPRGIDFPYLLSMLHDSFMSRANTIVCPGGKMDLAMQLIFTPMILRLMERRKEALARAVQQPDGGFEHATHCRPEVEADAKDGRDMARAFDCIAAVAFDLDGTLIDTAPDLVAAPM